MFAVGVIGSVGVIGLNKVFLIRSKKNMSLFSLGRLQLWVFSVGVIDSKKEPFVWV